MTSGPPHDPTSRQRHSFAGERIEADPWYERAAYQGTAAEVFFPTTGEVLAPDQRICTRCPVRADCAAYVLEADERFGIWGGLGEDARRQARRRRLSSRAGSGDAVKGLADAG